MEKKFKVEYVKLDDLKPSDYNPRRFSKQDFEQLKKSIKKFGVVDPLIVNSAENRKNVIIGGHFRYKVLKELGYKEVPVIFINIPDIRKERELNLRLNKNTGEWNFASLKELEEDFLSEVGFSDAELDKIFGIFRIDENATEEEIKAKIEKRNKFNVKLGDKFKLGNHLLICGDSTDFNIYKEINETQFDLIILDPFYSEDTPRELFDKFFEMTNTLIMMHRDPVIIKYAYEHPYFRYLLFFTKGHSLGIQKNRPYIRHTLVAVFYKKCSYIVTKGDPLYTYLGETNAVSKKKETTIFEKLIKHYAKRNGKVLDPYGGFGTTLIACENLNRKCVMFEIEPGKVSQIIDRWQKLTGKKAVKL